MFHGRKWRLLDFRSKISPLAVFLTLILFAFKKRFPDTYYISGPNSKKAFLCQEAESEEKLNLEKFRDSFFCRKTSGQFTRRKDSIYTT